MCLVSICGFFHPSNEWKELTALWGRVLAFPCSWNWRTHGWGTPETAAWLCTGLVAMTLLKSGNLGDLGPEDGLWVLEWGCPGWTRRAPQWPKNDLGSEPSLFWWKRLGNSGGSHPIRKLRLVVSRAPTLHLLEEKAEAQGLPKGSVISPLLFTRYLESQT